MHTHAIQGRARRGETVDAPPRGDRGLVRVRYERLGGRREVAVRVAEHRGCHAQVTLQLLAAADDLVLEYGRLEPRHQALVGARVASDVEDPALLHLREFVPIEHRTACDQPGCRGFGDVQRLVQPRVGACLADGDQPGDRLRIRRSRRDVDTGGAGGVAQPLQLSHPRDQRGRSAQKPRDAVGPERAARADEAGHCENRGGHAGGREQRERVGVVVVPTVIEGYGAGASRHGGARCDRFHPIRQPDDGQVLPDPLQVPLEGLGRDEHPRLLALLARELFRYDPVVHEDPQARRRARPTVGPGDFRAFPDGCLREGFHGVDCSRAEPHTKMSQPTILHVIDTTGPGGAETVFIELADRLRQEGFRSIPVIRGAGWVADRLRGRGMEPVIIPAKGSFNLRYLAALIRLIRKERVTLVQAHLLGSSVYCALAGLLTRTPVVATFHGMVDLSARERFVWLKRAALRFGVSRFVAVSRSLAEALADGGILDANRYTVIFNGIDTGRYNVPRTGWIHEQLGLPADAKISISLGNVRPAKAYDVLCRAAAALKDSHPELHFVIAGDPKKAIVEDLQRLCRELGVTDHVHFIGFQNDTPRVLAEADVFVLSSSSEGFSIATIEALAAGTPAVLTACGGPEEIAVPGQHALMVGVGDAEGLATAIRRVLESSDLAAQLECAGRALVRGKFDLDAMTRAYEAIYRSAQNP